MKPSFDWLAVKWKLRARFHWWVRSWLEIIDAICVIVSCTYFHPNFGFFYMAWADKRGLRKRMRENEQRKRREAQAV